MDPKSISRIKAVYEILKSVANTPGSFYFRGGSGRVKPTNKKQESIMDIMDELEGNEISLKQKLQEGYKKAYRENPKPEKKTDNAEIMKLLETISKGKGGSTTKKKAKSKASSKSKSKSKSKSGNPWIAHLKKWAKNHGISYRDALQCPAAKAAYKKKK